MKEYVELCVITSAVSGPLLPSLVPDAVVSAERAKHRSARSSRRSSGTSRTSEGDESNYVLYNFTYVSQAAKAA
jgi:hypothetical protein